MSENKTKIIKLNKDKNNYNYEQDENYGDILSKIEDTGKYHQAASSDSSTESQDDKGIFSDYYKLKYKNPIKRMYRIINEEELTEKASETAVRFYEVIIVTVILIFVILTGIIYYFSNMSYSAKIRKAENADALGQIEEAYSYYEEALAKTNNRNLQIEILNELVRISQEEEKSINLKSFLTRLALIDASNTEVVERLKTIYLEDNDIDSIMKLAGTIEENPNVIALYDILKNQPVFNYKSGTYDENLQLSITCQDGARVYYTIDGSEASENSIPYETPINLEEGKTIINAISINADGQKSKNYTQNYNIISYEPELVGVFPKSGSYEEETKIEIEYDSNCTVYYTLDGSIPDTSSFIYKKGMTIPYGNHIFTAVIYDQNNKPSEPISRAYIFEPEYDITLKKAEYSVKNALLDSGLLRQEGDRVYDFNGSEVFIDCLSIINYSKDKYYRFSVSNNINYYEEYAVNTENGATLKLVYDEQNNSYLSAIK